MNPVKNNLFSWVVILAVSVGFLKSSEAQNNTNSFLALVNTNTLPVMTYAAIDISGSVQGTNNVTQIALADNNTAYFLYTNVTPDWGRIYSDINYSGNFGSSAIYKWQAGQVTQFQTQSIVTVSTYLEPNYTEDLWNPWQQNYKYISYTPQQILKDGTLYGTQNTDILFYDANNNYAWPYSSVGFFESTLGVLENTTFGLPSPYDGQAPVGAGMSVNSADIGVCAGRGAFIDILNGTNRIWPPDSQELTNVCGGDFGYVIIGTNMTIFDPNTSWDHASNTSNFTIVPSNFTPSTINRAPSAVGTEADGNALLWANGNFYPLEGRPENWVFNDENQGLLRGFTNQGIPEGSFWETNGGSPQMLRSFMTPEVQKMYEIICPYAIGNQRNPAGNGITNADSSFNILAQAGTNGNKLVFQRDNTHHWTVYQQQFPTNIANLSLQNTGNYYSLSFAQGSVNAQGVMAVFGTPSGSNNTHAYLMVPVNIVPDYDRNGIINLNDYGYITTNNPFRFWINDTSESGDIASGGNDIPVPSSQQTGSENLYQTQVMGREDLINYFPLYFDISKLVSLLPPGQYSYWLSQANNGVHMVYTSLVPSQVGGFLTNSNVVSSYMNAPKTLVPSWGVCLSNSWVSSIGDTNTAGGVLLFDGIAKTTNPLVLSVFNSSNQQMARIEFPLSIDVIGNMYRTINLRGVTATPGSTDIPTSTGVPSNYPDDRRNGKMVVFVHGFNVDEPGATSWFGEAFKRLYQSGANSMFTGVLFNGNANGVDFWQNVENAFVTAPQFASRVNALPGSPTTVIAHSLGNIVVSSAINDSGLNIDHYIMLDAAMPMEAFDPSTFNQGQNTNMVNQAYNGYNTNLWASYWWTLFPSTDKRSQLTWLNRFPNVVGQVNFYSSGEEVLENGIAGDVTLGVGTTLGTTLESLLPLGITAYTPFAWYIQEETKGTFGGGVLMSVKSLNALLNEIPQGGWGFNTNWGSFNSNGVVVYTPPTQTNQLQTNPFFTPFTDSNLTGTYGNAEASISSVRATVLGKAIPALSYAVGANGFGKTVLILVQIVT